MNTVRDTFRRPVQWDGALAGRLAAAIVRPDVVRWSLLALAGCLVTTLVLAHLNAPWNRNANGWEGAFYSLVAQARLQDGLGNLAVPQTLLTGTLRTPYLNHPPLTGLLVASSFQLFGSGEAQARLVGLLAAAASALLFYRLVERTSSRSVAQLAFIALISMPLFVIHADLVSDIGPVELVFIMGTLFCMERYMAGRAYALPLGAVFGMLAVLVDYAVLFVLPPLVLAIMAVGAERKRFAIYTAGIVAAILVALGAYLVYVDLASGSLAFLVNRIAVRTGVDEAARVSLFEWVRQISTYQIVLLSPFVLGTVILGIAQAVRAGFTKVLAHRAFVLIGVLMLFGVSYVLVGSSGAYAHEYWQYYLMPGYALVTAVVWDGALRGTSRVFLSRWAWCLALAYVAIFTDAIAEPGASLLSRPITAAVVVLAGALFVLRKKTYLPLLALSVFVCLNLLVGWRYRSVTEPSDRDMGAVLAQATQPADIIVTTANSVPQQWYYSGRTIVPNSIPVGAKLEHWDALKTEDIAGLSLFIRSHQPIHLYLAEISLIDNASVRDWLASKCAYSEVAPRLVYIQRCDE